MDKAIEKNEYQTNIRKDVINLILKNKINPLKVLEIGGGAGFTSEYLCKLFNCPGTNIDIAVPINRSEIIRHIQLDISNTKLIGELKEDIFDLILVLDVVEHIENTELIIGTIKDLCANGSYVVLSLPNIKNIRVPYQIYLKNTFPRNNQGIFDKTHLRWFTMQDIKKLLVHNGFKIVDSSYSDHRSFFVKNKLFEKVFGFIFAPQFIVIAKIEK